MKIFLAKFGQHLGSIIIAMIVWWSVTILVGLALYQVWPPELISSGENGNAGSISFMLGVSLGRNWQNIPANAFGFVTALYAFRALVPSSNPKGQQTD